MMEPPPSFDKKMEPPPSFEKTISMMKMCLNVGGLRHEVMTETLKNLPESKLGKLALASTDEEIRGLCDFYVPENNEYFFDRSSKSFDQILTLYRTGKLHMNEDLCVLAFIDDLNYWGIDANLLEACCKDKFESRKESANDDLEKNLDIEDFKSGTCCFKFWNVLEDPTSSCGAMLLSWFSLAIVLLSLIVTTLNSFPSLSYVDEYGEFQDNPVFSRMELIIISFWTVEFIVRFIVCPNKCQFMKGGLNIIDLLAILPYIFDLFIMSYVSFDVIVIVMRILKLARYSAGVRTFASTLWKSGRELRLVFSLLIMGALIFGSTVFYIEKDEMETSFVHLGYAYYWAIVTMTTLGYGDMFPETGSGKLFATLCVIFGILCLALPIPLIINNFTKLYKDQIKTEKMKNAKKVSAWWKRNKRSQVPQ